ncbi:hypothetical protein QP888_05585 [Corynebacterium sp. MSK297]|uniref:hypothetical protein n=1 Tax=Corynebacterium sp. MSK297 TaxID=3050221 RepID=UPI00254CE512|nr:hypothetical protein [Corynebacterium sp. MSK297]MDK8845984.1 hypothetical protein [Corynebacterium sp. MSK297]
MASESLATVTQYTPSGARVNGRGDQGVVSHEQDDAADKPTPERWRLDEVRPTTDVYSTGNDDFDAIGARMSARHDAGGVVTVDNRHVLNDTPGLPGFDY